MSKPEKKQKANESRVEWTRDEIRRFLYRCGVLTNVRVQGLREAATAAFRRYGYRLATICREPKRPERLYRLSLYVVEGQRRQSQSEMEGTVKDVFRQIQCPLPKADATAVVVSGGRTVITAWLPRWVRE
jgi:hypothetical protein